MTRKRQTSRTKSSSILFQTPLSAGQEEFPIATKHHTRQRHRRSYRQLGVSPSNARPVDRSANIRPHDGNSACESGDSPEEVAKQDADAVRLDEKADKGPPDKDQQQPCEKGRGALCFLPPREEEECLGGPDYYGEADEEENLLFGRVSFGSGST